MSIYFLGTLFDIEHIISYGIVFKYLLIYSKCSICNQKQNEYKDKHVVVPLIFGHSMGGLFAGVISSKLRIASVLINPLGLENKSLKFVGANDWNMANGPDLDKHITLYTNTDWVSGKKSSFRIREKTKLLRGIILLSIE